MLTNQNVSLELILTCAVSELLWTFGQPVRAETPVVSELWWAITTTLGEILRYIEKTERGYRRHTLGEILREITKDSHQEYDTTYRPQYM